jgi:prepilin-type N-terminal cleavage/methylation domain-containing protein
LKRVALRGGSTRSARRASRLTTNGSTDFERRGEAGVTLIELMVSLVVLSIAVSGVLSLGASLMNGYRENRQVVVAERSVRGSLDIVADAVRNTSPGVPNAALEDLVGCSISGAIEVINSNSAPDALQVIHATGGTLTSIRQVFTPADTTLRVLDGTGLKADDYIIVTNLDQGHLIKITDVQPSGGEFILTLEGAPATLCGGATFPPGDYREGDIVVRAQISLFYVDSSAAVGNIPTLMVDLDGNGPLVPEPIAAGIEDFQVALGVDVDADGTVFEDGSTVDEWFYNAQGDPLPPPAITPRALRITVAGRTISESTNTGIYRRPAIEDRLAASALDPFRRRQLTTIVEIRNLEGSP